MSANFDLFIRGGSCILSGGIVTANIGVHAGKIVALGAPTSASAAEIFDADGLHIFLGIIDTHVYFREPGFEHKENMETGSSSAVVGGVGKWFFRKWLYD